MLGLRCKPYHANQHKMVKIMLIVLNVGASISMSHLVVVKAIACSHSCFAPIVSCV
jgi:hypothetical protein